MYHNDNDVKFAVDIFLPTGRKKVLNSRDPSIATRLKMCMDRKRDYIEK